MNSELEHCKDVFDLNEPNKALKNSLLLEFTIQTLKIILKGQERTHTAFEGQYPDLAKEVKVEILAIKTTIGVIEKLLKLIGNE